MGGGIINWLGVMWEAKKKIPELKRLIGEGNIDFSVKTVKGKLTLHIIIIDPSMELEELADSIISVLPEINLKDIHIILDMTKKGRKLLKDVHT